MDDTAPPKVPKMQFIDEKGVYKSEYMPAELTDLEIWIGNKYLDFRDYFNKDIHYWHTRHQASASSRKIQDLAFIQHVVSDHGLEPEDKLEKRYYERVWKLYGHEYTSVLAEIGKDKDNEWDDRALRKGHPYAYAYAEHWLLKHMDIEIKLLYHGVSYYQYNDLVLMLRERAHQQLLDYREEHGLDMETGEKLKPADEPKKSESILVKPDKKLKRPKQKQS